MFEIGDFRARVCQGITRRSFLRAGASVPLGLGLTASGLSPCATQAAEYTAGKAKSVVLVWLWGAPSHLDTFDPKPTAPSGFRGPFASIATQTPGVQFTELVPRLAARSHRFSLIRSNVNYAGGHPDAGSFSLTGYQEKPTPLQPSFGSIVARHYGQRALPSYMMVGRGIPKDVVKIIDGYGGGEWGRRYDPFLVGCTEQGELDIPALKLLEGLTPDRLADRRLLTGELDRLRHSVAPAQFDQWNDNQKQAFTLLTSRSSIAALDMSRETVATREAYGQTSFGQSLLLARRLVEAEVPFVHVNWSEYVEACTPRADFGWDTHIYNFDLLPNRHCPIFDRAMSAFLDDLYDRGLIDSTLVVCLGEFGRTPKINNRAARDHWPQCYFSMWAGGGVKAGRVIGRSDYKGEHPVTRPIDPAAVGVTMLDLVGVNSEARAKLAVMRGAEFIHELV